MQCSVSSLRMDIRCLHIVPGRCACIVSGYCQAIKSRLNLLLMTSREEELPTDTSKGPRTDQVPMENPD